MINIQLAIDHFGSQAALAKALGVNPMAVTQWKKRGLPIIRALQIERITKGEVKAEKLLPDILNTHLDNEIKQQSSININQKRRVTDNFANNE